MRKQFVLNTEPHIAEVGDVELSFLPEVLGDDFLEAYSRIQEVAKRFDVDLSGEGAADIDLSEVREVNRAMREFLAQLMTPESAKQWLRWDVVVGGKAVGSYVDFDEATEDAAKRPNAQVVDEGIKLPDRVLVELLDWTTELYGGGNRPTGSSVASAPVSPRPGTRGRGVSPSKGSTSTRGRSR